MKQSDIENEIDKISDKLDELGWDLGGFQGQINPRKPPKEPMFLLGRQFELLKLLNKQP